MKDKLLALRYKISQFRENMLDHNGYTNELEAVHSTSEIMLFLQDIEDELLAMNVEIKMQESKRVSDIMKMNKQIHNG